MEASLLKLFVSKKEAARALSVSLRSLDYLISRGELRTRRVGRRVLIPVGTLQQFAKGDHPDILQPNSDNKKAADSQSAAEVEARSEHATSRR